MPSVFLDISYMLVQSNMWDFYTGTGASVQGKRDVEAPNLR